MAIDDVLDDRQSQSRATRAPAHIGIDTIEPLGQARQMLGGNAGTVIAHRDARLVLAVGRSDARQNDLAYALTPQKSRASTSPA